MYHPSLGWELGVVPVVNHGNITRNPWLAAPSVGGDSWAFLPCLPGCVPHADGKKALDKNDLVTITS